MVLVGAVISQITGSNEQEKSSGEGYYKYVRGMLDSVGMKNTGLEPEDTQVSGLSKGYTKGPDGLKSNADTLPYRGTPAGGGYSTVEDMGKFASALLNNKLLDQKHKEELLEGKTNLDPTGKQQYAYGFYADRSKGERSNFHPGGAPGMNGDLIIYPDSKQIVVVLSNMDFPAAKDMAGYIDDRVRLLHGL